MTRFLLRTLEDMNKHFTTCITRLKTTFQASHMRENYTRVRLEWFINGICSNSMGKPRSRVRPKIYYDNKCGRYSNINTVRRYSFRERNTIGRGQLKQARTTSSGQ